MRVLSTQEMAVVAGGGILDDMIQYCQDAFSSLSAYFFTSASIPVVTITANRLTDAQKIASLMDDLRSSMPDCTVALTYAGTVTTGNVQVGVSRTGPTVGGTVVHTYTAPTRTFTCPPKSGIPQQPSR